MKKVFCMLLAGIILCVVFCGCGSDDYSNDDNDYSYSYDDNDDDYSYSYDDNDDDYSYSHDDNDYSYSNDNYDYDKGYGYTAPEPGESFSDYVKRQDPDLYNDMQDRWDSLS